MTVDDIEAVVALEETAYGPHHSHKDYVYELEKNQYAHNYVAHVFPPPAPDLSPSPDLIGCAGFWLLADEIHISTLAVHPARQRSGLGAWLLLNLLEAGQALGGTLATLEVRVSNHAALALYNRFHFQEVARRAGYYANGEDALILTTPTLASPQMQAFLQHQRVLVNQRIARIMDND